MASVVVEETVVRTRRGLSCAAREEERTTREVVEGGDKGDRRSHSEPLGLSPMHVGNARDGSRIYDGPRSTALLCSSLPFVTAVVAVLRCYTGRYMDYWSSTHLILFVSFEAPLKHT